ncbi:hypothetical protein NZD89_08155 [Alicyclobacillus fastidiosus]|uniref:Uncharacterized protein n=1 Tax=Alicyclobacillus fastidiosus TaxID=392011 RepID=A0ABY6ZKD2_9BACL|nr:hypothetical protein [Alicyclobacillus fastidiosus]WAH43352.1 hypothetical protein NZD89_08155 [Alicyclobacillus fastidiosus]GMA65410.1 hypothetical protein GCM10025859_58500 [Alicyclobacillus fastidiosus]
MAVAISMMLLGLIILTVVAVALVVILAPEARAIRSCFIVLLIVLALGMAGTGIDGMVHAIT